MNTHHDHKIYRNYILKFNEDLMHEFVSSRIVTSIAHKTKCCITLANRILNRAIRPGSWDRFFIINITAKDLFDIDKCNRLLERTYPAYTTRKSYKSKSSVVIMRNEWLPDNTPLSTNEYRSGCLRSQFGSLHIHSPHANNYYRPKVNTPWKITRREVLGHYQTLDIYDQIYFNSHTPPKIRSDNYVTPKEVAYFNLPNEYDRYTTFKAIDNEHVEFKLQAKCKHFWKAFEAKDLPKEMKVMNQKESSVAHVFSKFESKNQSKVKSQKLVDTGPSHLNSAVSLSEEANIEGTTVQEESLDEVAQPHIELDQNQNQHFNNNTVVFRHRRAHNLSGKFPCNFYRSHCRYFRKYPWKYKRKSSAVKFSNKSTNTCNFYSPQITLKSAQKHEYELNYSQITSLSSNCTTINENNNSNALTNASKSSNFDDNTLDSLKSI